MGNNSKSAFFWHRRDLRIHDNHGLYKALTSGSSVIPLFIFDSTILSKLQPDDQRVLFIYQQIEKLKKIYASLGSDLIVFHGNPTELLPKLCEEYGIEKIFTNRDYEPNAINRDLHVFETLKSKNIEFIGAKDHVIFEKNEVLKDDGKPYTVFTPYANKWKKTLSSNDLKPFESLEKTNNLIFKI